MADRPGGEARAARSGQDAFDDFEYVLCARDDDAVNPWAVDGRFVADTDLLARLLEVPVADAVGTESGRLAKGIDAWVAAELRRAGFGADEVWPRRSRPRVLPHEVAELLGRLPGPLAKEVRRHLLRSPSVGPTEARVLGRAYVKQVDVLVARWSRGPELLVSTKSMASSYRKNLANRFEEAYGDAKNLRGRYPLAAIGFLFLLRSTVLSDQAAYEKALDMLRKLRAELDVYDATGVVVAEWSDTAPADGVRVCPGVVPDDLSCDRFLGELVRVVLERTPVEMHVRARERREHRPVPVVAPAESSADAADPDEGGGAEEAVTGEDPRPRRTDGDWGPIPGQLTLD